MTDTTDAAALAGMVENALRMAMTTITGQDDDWEEIAMAQIEAGIDHAAALDGAARDLVRWSRECRNDRPRLVSITQIAGLAGSVVAS